MLINIVTKKLWSAIFLFVVVLVLVICAMTVLLGLLEKNKEANATLSGYIGGNTDITILKQDIAEAGEIQETLKGWLLAPQDTVNLVTYVESISEQAGLSPTIEDLNAGKTIIIGDEESAALELVVRLEGTFDETQQFLTLMENIPYQSDLGDVRLQSSGQASQDDWQIMIQAIVYTSPQK